MTRIALGSQPSDHCLPKGRPNTRSDGDESYGMRTLLAMKDTAWFCKRHTFMEEAIYLHVTSERIHVALVMCNQLEPKHICSIIPLLPTTSSTSTILLRRIHIRQHGIAGWKQASQCSSCSSTAYQQPPEAHDQRIAKGRQWAQDHTNTHLKWNQAT